MKLCNWKINDTMIKSLYNKCKYANWFPYGGYDE